MLRRVYVVKSTASGLQCRIAGRFRRPTLIEVSTDPRSVSPQPWGPNSYGSVRIRGDLQAPLALRAGRRVHQPLWPRVVISRAPTGVRHLEAPADPPGVLNDLSHGCLQTVDGYEQIVMIFSCGDRKPSDHLGIESPRIGLRGLGCVPG
ncbi:MAG TPA: hypothetical protein VFT17_03730 [Propionibacteriaceae bacterium]|nr:hypothetical protein [Propionibacteriaceae bacterium]